MELLIALMLAVVQGIAEWFPVSSSGHLALLELLFGYGGGLFFGVALHFGTLMAVFVYFVRDITNILRELLSLRFQTQMVDWVFCYSLLVFLLQFQAFYCVRLLRRFLGTSACWL